MLRAAPVGLVRVTLMGRRVLVTGLGTFWGGRVAQALEHDPAVDVIVGLDREEPTVALERTEYVRADESYSILDPHRAGDPGRHDPAHVPGRRLDPDAGSRTMHEINVIGTMNLFAAARRRAAPCATSW